MRVKWEGVWRKWEETRELGLLFFKKSNKWKKIVPHDWCWHANFTLSSAYHRAQIKEWSLGRMTLKRVSEPNLGISQGDSWFRSYREDPHRNMGSWREVSVNIYTVRWWAHKHVLTSFHKYQEDTTAKIQIIGNPLLPHCGWQTSGGGQSWKENSTITIPSLKRKEYPDMQMLSKKTV